MRRFLLSIAALLLFSGVGHAQCTAPWTQTWLYTVDSGNNQHVVACLDPTTGNVKWLNLATVVQDLGGETFSVDAYGAKGDGVTVDNTAVQAAADAAGQNGIFFSCGKNYVLTTTIIVGPNAPIRGCSSGASNSTRGTTITWNGAGNGPIFSETQTAVNGSNLFTRSVQEIGGFTMQNTGAATALIGIQLSNITGAHLDHINAAWTGGACVNLNNTASLWTERTSFGPDINFFCGTDISFTVNGGTNSFGYTSILGSHLDGHAIDVGVGADLYHSTIIYKSNVPTGVTNMTFEGSATSNYWDVRGEGSAGCSVLNIAANVVVEGQGMVLIAGCTQGTINASGFYLITANGQGDGNVVSSLGLVPSSAVTTTVATDRADQPSVSSQPLSVFGMWADAVNGYGGAYVLLRNTAQPDRGCFRVLNGTKNSTATDSVSLCADSTLRLTPITFAQMSAAPYTGRANGTEVFCSDCNATCTAGGGTGRTCFRENGAWTH